MAGKSFLALDMAAKVVMGEPVLGRKSKGCGVVYIASEDAPGVRLRIKALREKTGPLRERFKLVPQAPNLTELEDVADLKESLREQKEAFDARGDRLGLVVVDTMSASIPGADENTAKDMSPVLTALQEMATELGLMVLVVAHTGKNAEAGIRGWSGLLANADGLIMLDEYKGAEPRIGKVVKVKNGPAGDKFAFALDRVVIGYDEDGDEVSTCMVDEVNLPDGSDQPDKSAKKVDGDAFKVKQAIVRLVDEGQTHVVPNHVPGRPSQRVAVKLSELRRKAYDLGLRNGEAPEDPADEKAAKSFMETRKKAFERGLERLESSRTIRREGDLIWEMLDYGDSRGTT
jgi:hypothetical protein